ncbi:Short-chain dehydrogenase TIC 32- chloroplastic [Apiospora phragmitis]|uniref:3beta-hydroxysteroid 3-dehydrogenase n=1 Tax=Apiospora phragmitis TaxID=2905665 RepID=A0ABR1VXX5_9PEZI
MPATASKGTIVLTGANGGLGSAIAANVASSSLAADYRGIYGVRDPASAPALMRALQQNRSSHGHEVTTLHLEQLDSMRGFAASINARVSRQEIPPDPGARLERGLSRVRTADMVAPFAVIATKHGPREGEDRGSRQPHPRKEILGDGIEPIVKGTWSSSQGDPSWCSGIRRYAAPKLCLVMMIGELQESLDKDPLLGNICVLGVDPGWMATGIARRHPQYVFVRTIMPWVAALLSWLKPSGMFRTPARSAGDVVAAMLGNNSKGVYFKGARPAEVSAEARDRAKRLMVWRDSVGYARLREGETMLADWR